MKARSAVWVSILGCTAVLSLASSCGDDHGSCGTAATVNVTLREFMVTPDRPSAPQGNITFHVANAGTEDHEFLVLRTDLPADALPQNEDGSYMEDGPGTELIDEIEEFPAGTSEDLTLSLAAGDYVLLCNRVEIDDDEVEAHYALGMFAAFTVQ